MKNNAALLLIIFYMIFSIAICFLPLLEFVDFESLDLPWDHARITDVDYTAKVLDTPGKRWTSTCHRTINFRYPCSIKK